MIIKIIINLIILLVLSGCSTERIDLSKIHQLNEAANFLMLVSDNEKGVINNCSLSSEEALNLLQPLHAMIDEETPKYIDKISEASLMNCSVNCQCGIYSDLVTNQSIKEKLLNELKIKGKKQLIECANKSAKWLCQSPLIKKLKQEVEPKNNSL